MKVSTLNYLLTGILVSMLMACVSSKDTGGTHTPDGEGKLLEASQIQILEPIYDSTIGTLTPRFVWTSVGEGVSYEFKLFDVSDPKNPVQIDEETGLSTTQYEPDITLEPATDYGWIVRFVKDGVPSEWVMHETKVFTGISYHRRKRFQRFKTP